MPISRRISIWTLDLLVTVAVHTAGAASPAAVVEVQQQVGLEVGYHMDGVDHILASGLDPAIPQGRSDADLKVSTARYGTSGSATLASRFRENGFAVRGLASASGTRESPPEGAEGMHVGSAATFLARLSTDSVPARFRFDGSIGVGFPNARAPHSGHMSVHARLVTGSGVLLWQQTLDGAAQDKLRAVSFSETLMPNQEYRFALYAEANALSGREQEELGIRAAWFDLDAVISAAPATDVSESRALLVTITPELEVQEVDGRRIDPFQTERRQGFREYSLPGGEHTLTASFHRIVPITNESIEDLRGFPLSLTHFFLDGHEYVLLHRAHTNGEHEPMGGMERIVRSLLQPSRSHWSAEVIDLADIRRQMGSVPLDREVSQGPDRSRQAERDREAMAESAVTPDMSRLGLTPEEVTAIRRYLTLDAEEPTTREGEARSERPITHVSP